MKKITGVLEAPGAGVQQYVGLGFVPDRVVVTNVTDRTGLIFNRDFMVGGAGVEAFGLAIAADGVRAVTSSALDGVDIFDIHDIKDIDSSTVAQPEKTDQRTGGTGEITLFTLDTAGDNTGHFNEGVNTSKVGVGSKVYLGQETSPFRITALTNDGDATDEVTLDRTPPASAKVNRITSRFSYYNLDADKEEEIFLGGFVIGSSATINDTDGDILVFEAELFDN